MQVLYKPVGHKHEITLSTHVLDKVNLTDYNFEDLNSRSLLIQPKPAYYAWL